MPQTPSPIRLNKTAVVCSLILAIAAVVGVYLYSNTNRYVTANGGKGELYRIDRKTGRAVQIHRGEERPVVSFGSVERSESPSERAVSLAKYAMTLDPGSYKLSNDSWILEHLRRETGHLRIIGWKASRIDDQTYVVTYSFETGDGARCYPFEVNLEAGIVRNIGDNTELERKYGYGGNTGYTVETREAKERRMRRLLNEDARIRPARTDIVDRVAEGFATGRFVPDKSTSPVSPKQGQKKLNEDGLEIVEPASPRSPKQAERKSELTDEDVFGPKPLSPRPAAGASAPVPAPQLTPIQMQFLQTLSNAPPGAVPFSGAGGLQGFSAPGYAAVYQPAQSFDDPEYQQRLRNLQKEVQRQRADTVVPRGQPRRIARTAYVTPSDGHWIEEVLADGKIIKLEDASLWKVADLDTITSALWLPLSTITVIDGNDPSYPYKLVNTDDGEMVDAKPLSQ